MNYLLFDLTVLASFIAVAAWKLLGDGNSLLAPECHVPDGDNTNQTSIPRHQHQHQQQHDIFEIGDMVEVYEPKIHQEYAFFAQIDHIYPQDDGSIKYEIRSGPTRALELFQDIDSSRIRAHEPLGFKSRVMCDYGLFLASSSKLAPCTILSYSDDERQSYYVLGMIDGRFRHHELPMSRIRPIVDMSSALEDEFKRMIFLESLYYEDSNHLTLWGVVEHYDDNSFSAAPLIITSYKEDGKINLHHIFSSTHLPGIDRAVIRPYHIYGDGTDALCKVGKWHKMHITPCTVVYHSIMESGSVSYHVSYLNEDEKKKTLVHGNLSFTKVQRIIVKGGGK